MDNMSIVFAVGYTLVAIVAVFILREKYPNRYLIGFVLCLLAPAWGQIYVKSKYNWLPWMFMMSIERGVSKAGPTDSLVPWLVVGAISSVIIYFRILSVKEVPQSAVVPVEDQDRDYVSKINKRLDEAGVESERDLV